jgi:hypothetical protein
MPAIVDRQKQITDARIADLRLLLQAWWELLSDEKDGAGLVAFGEYCDFTGMVPSYWGMALRSHFP